MAIKVYSTPTCPWCKKVKEFLKENDIKFTDIDVSNDESASKEMVKISGQIGVPVIDVNGTIISGFDETKLKKALKI
jgi:glutaredoxin-like YruB-family protein